MTGDDFLSRWSRRKREVVLEAPATPAEPVPRPEGGARLPAAGDAALDGDTLTDEAIAALPSLESFTVETDLTQFLRAGIPQVLRNAALRRMWSIDPSIRDYLCEAREYAFDWHIPGAVPGTGPMLPTDDIAGMVRDVFAGSNPPAVEPDQAAAPDDENADTKSTEPEEPPQDTQAAAIVASDPAPSPVPDDGPETTRRPEAEPVRTNLEATPGGRLRRHGGASPI